MSSPSANARARRALAARAADGSSWTRTESNCGPTRLPSAPADGRITRSAASAALSSAGESGRPMSRPPSGRAPEASVPRTGEPLANARAKWARTPTGSGDPPRASARPTTSRPLPARPAAACEVTCGRSRRGGVAGETGSRDGASGEPSGRRPGRCSGAAIPRSSGTAEGRSPGLGARGRARAGGVIVHARLTSQALARARTRCAAAVRSSSPSCRASLSPCRTTLRANRHGTVTSTQERAPPNVTVRLTPRARRCPLAAFIAGVAAVATRVMHIALGSHWRLARPSRYDRRMAHDLAALDGPYPFRWPGHCASPVTRPRIPANCSHISAATPASRET